MKLKNKGSKISKPEKWGGDYSMQLVPKGSIKELFGSPVTSTKSKQNANTKTTFQSATKAFQATQLLSQMKQSKGRVVESLNKVHDRYESLKKNLLDLTSKTAPPAIPEPPLTPWAIYTEKLGDSDNIQVPIHGTDKIYISKFKPDIFKQINRLFPKDPHP